MQPFLQGSAGQEWERERSELPFGLESISEVVQLTLKTLVGELQERPRYKGRSFPWTLWYSNGRQAHDAKLMDAREDATFAVDFRLSKGDRETAQWLQRSAQEPLLNRLVWVVGEGSLEGAAREFLRSQRMVERYKPRWASLPRAKQSLVLGEETRLEELEGAARKAVAVAFHQGSFYFRGQQIRPQDMGAVFDTALLATANRLLPDLYPYAAEMVAVTDTEILQLLEPELHGPSPKFLDDALGILSLDDRKYVPNCKGEHPRRIEEEIRKTGGLSGQSLIATFVGVSLEQEDEAFADASFKYFPRAR